MVKVINSRIPLLRPPLEPKKMALTGMAIIERMTNGCKPEEKTPETRTFCNVFKVVNNHDLLIEENTLKIPILVFYNFTSHIMTDRSDNVV